MKFRIIGATDGRVTGSCTHFNYERKNVQFLVDCGMIQGEGNDANENSKPFPFSPCDIKYVFLTHAHIDHCGLLPKLYRDGFSGQVICTKATARLAEISLLDSAKHVNGLYTENDVKKIRFRCIDESEKFGFSVKMPIDGDLFVTFTRTAHILGSASVRIWWINDKEKLSSIVMSGDLGNNTKNNQFQPLLAGRQGIFGCPDAIVVESTYGGRVREKQLSDFDARISKLKEIVQKEVFEKKSLLIIPAFSLQRTQELLFDLHYVLNKFYSQDEDCLSPNYVFNTTIDEFNRGYWNGAIHRCLMDSVGKLSENEQKEWNCSFVEAPDAPPGNFALHADSKLTFDDIKRVIFNNKLVYPVDIIIDSSLARKMSAVFRDELCRRQPNTPLETLYRNRKLAERLGVNNEDEVDDVLRTLLPADDNAEIVSAIGIHSVKYTSQFKTPRTSALQARGGILITGGGMCEGGPVVEHLRKVLNAKRHSSVLVTGYMAEQSLGAKLVCIGNDQDRELPISINDFSIGESTICAKEITTKIIQMQGYYSGHADQKGLLDFIFHLAGGENENEASQGSVVFLNHGQHAARKTLKEQVELRISTPESGDRKVAEIELPNDPNRWYDLNLKQWLELEEDSSIERLLKELLFEQRRTNQFLQRLVERQFAPREHNTQNFTKRKSGIKKNS